MYICQVQDSEFGFWLLIKITLHYVKSFTTLIFTSGHVVKRACHDISSTHLRNCQDTSGVVQDTDFYIKTHCQACFSAHPITIFVKLSGHLWSYSGHRYFCHDIVSIVYVSTLLQHTCEIVRTPVKVFRTPIFLSWHSINCLYQDIASAHVWNCQDTCGVVQDTDIYATT